MQLDAAAKRLDLVLVEHLGQLVELDLGAGVLRMLQHALRLALDRPLQAADLRVLVDRLQRLVVGIGLEALGQDLLGLVEIAVPAIDVGQLEVGVDRLGVGHDLLDQPLLGRELLLLEPLELGFPRLGRLGRGRGGSLVQRVVEPGPLDRRAGREGVDLAVGVLVVGMKLLDLLPAARWPSPSSRSPHEPGPRT